MKHFSLLLFIIISFAEETYAENISGTWEGFTSSSEGSPAYVRLHINDQGGYLLRSVPYGQASVYVVPFKKTDISINDGIVRIVVTEPSRNNKSHVETVIIFSIRQNPIKESRSYSSAIGSTFEYLLSPIEARTPFYTYAFELNDVQGESVIDAIGAATDKYERKPSIHVQRNSDLGAGVP